jgi:hypothetical protein
LLYTNVFLRLEPLGLELVAEAAGRARHQVRLIDLQVESHADYHRMIAEWQPDFIAFSCNYLANVPEIVDLAISLSPIARSPLNSVFSLDDLVGTAWGTRCPRPERLV